VRLEPLVLALPPSEPEPLAQPALLLELAQLLSQALERLEPTLLGELELVQIARERYELGWNWHQSLVLELEHKAARVEA
jgi:hypothetical protein